MRQLFNSQWKLTQGFGERPEYYGQFGLKGHEGADLIPSDGDWTVKCLADGVIIKDEDNARSGAYGVNVTVWHPQLKKATQYCHLEYNQVFINQVVKMGEPLGKMGTTGNSSGPHVHLNVFDVDENGIRLNRDNGYLGGTDPLPFLEQDLAMPTPPDNSGIIPLMPDYFKGLLQENNLDLNNEGQIRAFFGDAKDAPHLRSDLANALQANTQQTEVIADLRKQLQDASVGPEISLKTPLGKAFLQLAKLFG